MLEGNIKTSVRCAHAKTRGKENKKTGKSARFALLSAQRALLKKKS
jgi:hypothetical protein